MYNRNNNRGGRDVCKFFLEGRCRFGDSCKNEHPGDGGGGSSSSNRFAPLQNGSGGNARGRSGALSGIGGQNQTSSQYGVIADGIRLDLTENSQKGERPQWEFSAYAPGVGAPRQLLEGQVEQSEEEMRVMCYLANATGQLQAYDQHVNGLRNEMTRQIQTILNDTEGARRYVQEGEHHHPNRIDLVQKSKRDFPWENKPTVPIQHGNAFGQPNGASTAFGQASSLGAASPFGQPSTGGGVGASAFGQASSIGGVKPAFGQSTFGQASQPTSSVFGQPSQPTSAFGQASQIPAASVFGRPAQPSASTFGQPSQPSAVPFGQQPQQPPANTFGQQHQTAAANPFGQAQQPAANLFGQPQPQPQPQPQQPVASTFGQPSQPAANPFGQASQAATNPFGQPAQPAPPAFGNPSSFGAATPAKPGFGTNPFGQQPTQSPFGQAPQTTSTFGQSSQPASAFGLPSGRPSVTGFPAQASTPSAGSSGTANGTFQGQRVYKGRNDHPTIKVRKDGVERDTRIWFPNGPPTTAAPDTEGEPSAYEGEKGALLKACYDEVKVSGVFPQGIMPECPPKREWVSFDL